MKYYSSVQKVNVDKETIEKALSFSQNVVSTTNYSDSNQTSVSKIMNDHFISKIGEEAAKKILSKYAAVVGPDYRIYKEKEKSWDEDLYVNKVGLAVKTQKRSAAIRYGLSWTFQLGSFRKDPVLSKPDAWVVFVEYDDYHPYNCSVYPPYKIKELTFGEPKLTRLRGCKKVVYAETLPK